MNAAGSRAPVEVAARDLGVAGVELVAQHGAADVGQVHSDLMGAAGLWQDLESRETGESLEDVVKGGRLATGGVAGADGHFFPLLRMNANRLRDQIAIAVGHADGNGEVFFLGRAGF